MDKHAPNHNTDRHAKEIVNGQDSHVEDVESGKSKRVRAAARPGEGDREAACPLAERLRAQTVEVCVQDEQRDDMRLARRGDAVAMAHVWQCRNAPNQVNSSCEKHEKCVLFKRHQFLGHFQLLSLSSGFATSLKRLW